VHRARDAEPTFALELIIMANKIVLPFEKPVVELLDKVQEVRTAAETDDTLLPELKGLEEQAEEVARELFLALSPIQKVQLSRHANRPYTLDYVERLFTDWVELHGDRRFSDDAAIVGGLARFRGRSVVVVGHQKGRNTKENVIRNFGMPHPEGYRKAIRLYEMGNKFGLPILTFIDTPGAYPGIGAEERGQSEAIGAAIAAMARATVPIIAVIIGEGGSGGALALAVANRVLVLELGCYSVISPEGCAAILYKDGARANEAAEQLKITAKDLYGLDVVDDIIREPPGGAHHDYDLAAQRVGDAIAGALDDMRDMTGEAIAAQRYDRFRALGQFTS
jgi:acetyl-CoA carboxylase carboxyl transferase subunit alpha